jgi:hypothetical protein
MSGMAHRGTHGVQDDHRRWHWLAISLAAILLLTPACGGGMSANATNFNPGIVALPHWSYAPSVVDAIARGIRPSGGLPGRLHA